MKLLLVVFAALILVEDSADAIKCYACGKPENGAKISCSKPTTKECVYGCSKSDILGIQEKAS
jgi:hypothetical protein